MRNLNRFDAIYIDASPTRQWDTYYLRGLLSDMLKANKPIYAYGTPHYGGYVVLPVKFLYDIRMAVIRNHLIPFRHAVIHNYKKIAIMTTSFTDSWAKTVSSSQVNATIFEAKPLIIASWKKDRDADLCPTS